jgi:hypothetical protein
MPKLPSKSALASRLKKSGAKSIQPSIQKPVWDGPESDSANGGITQSMISRFLCCRERFRLRVVEGIAEVDTFNHRIEYGQMWHICEERFAEKDSWDYALHEYCKSLCRRYPL